MSACGARGVSWTPLGGQRCSRGWRSRGGRAGETVHALGGGGDDDSDHRHDAAAGHWRSSLPLEARHARRRELEAGELSTIAIAARASGWKTAPPPRRRCTPTALAACEEVAAAFGPASLCSTRATRHVAPRVYRVPGAARAPGAPHLWILRTARHWSRSSVAALLRPRGSRFSRVLTRVWYVVRVSYVHQRRFVARAKRAGVGGTLRAPFTSARIALAERASRGRDAVHHGCIVRCT